jgi:hypothetical protein
MNEPAIDAFAQATALDILTRTAPDCLHRRELRQAIARLARQGLEGHLRLYLAQQRPAPAGQQTPAAPST